MEKFNIYFRKDGRYEGRILRGKRKNGQRKYQYVFGRTREEVQNKIRAIRKGEMHCRQCSKTVTELFSEWFQSIGNRVKESTAANYAMKANKHIIPEFGAKSIDSLICSDINSFIEKKQNQGLSSRYVIDIVVLMKSVFKYAVKTYHIMNPMDGVVMPRKKSPEIVLLDEDEQKRLQQYVAGHQDRTTGYCPFHVHRYPDRRDMCFAVERY